MKKFLFFLILVLVIALSYFSFLGIPKVNTIDPNIQFGFFGASNTEHYQSIKELGVDFITVANFTEENLEKRLNEAKKYGLSVYISMGVLNSEDYDRVKRFGNRSVVKGFYLDEPHLHKQKYNNSDIKNWLIWSNRNFPGKKNVIATPRIDTYKEILKVLDPNQVALQPDYYPIMGPFKDFVSQRKIVKRMLKDNFEVQPILQSHALNFYETGDRRKVIDFVSLLEERGLTLRPTVKQVVDQIKNVSVNGVKLIWFYPNEDRYVKWDEDRKEYFKKIFKKLGKLQ